MQYLIGVVPPAEIGARLRAEFRYGTEPHVTVKAQSGLTDERINDLTSSITLALEALGSFEVELGPMSTFGDRVAYISIQSPRIHDLHQLLLDLVNPAHQERLRYHELGPYTPHLTIRRGKNLDFKDVAARVAKLGALPPFIVDSVWLFKQEANGQPYQRAAEFRLS